MFRWDSWDSSQDNNPNPETIMDLPIKKHPRTEMTKLLCSIPYSIRVQLHQLSASTGVSQQTIIRTALASYLLKRETPAPPAPITPPAQPAPPEPEYLPHRIRVAPETKATRTRKPATRTRKGGGK